LYYCLLDNTVLYHKIMVSNLPSFNVIGLLKAQTT